MSGAIFGLAALFPSQYISAIVSGQALGGIISALIYILIVAFRASPTETAFVYFIIGSALVLTTIISYFTLEKNLFFSFYVKNETHPTISTQENTVDLSNSSENTECKTWDIFCKIYTHSTSICLLYAITVSIYPSVAVLMQSVDYGHGKVWSGKINQQNISIILLNQSKCLYADVYYMPVVNYLLFNSGDYFGRILAGIFDKVRINISTSRFGEASSLSLIIIIAV